MHFEYIPELKITYGYFVLLGLMATIATFSASCCFAGCDGFDHEASVRFPFQEADGCFNLSSGDRGGERHWMKIRRSLFRPWISI